MAPSSKAKNYNPAKLIITFNHLVLGGVTLSGRAKGKFFDCDFYSDMAKLYVGADGEGARAISNDLSGFISVSVMQTASIIDYFNRAVQLDRAFGTGQLSINVNDILGNFVASAAGAWCKKPPKIERADDIKEDVWVWDTALLIRTDGSAFPTA